MKLSAAERDELRAAFRQMTLPQKADYIFTYYKGPLILAALAIVVLGNVIYRQLTDRTPVLYVAFADLALGDEMEQTLNGGFIATLEDTPVRPEVSFYRDLYITGDPSTPNHEYAYASTLKVLASITAQQMDVVLMNREAYDVFSQKGYLAPLPPLLAQDSALAEALTPWLTENTVVLEDNSIEVALEESDEYQAVTEQSVNGIALAGLSLLTGAGFDGEVFVGVVGNTPRTETVLRYLAYLAQLPAA